jgi:adenosylcobinamide kinase / adenosylcobinamide-phosphate guanylyltransferase
VLGGLRSGKSRWAESAVAAYVGTDGTVRYVATGSSDQRDVSWSARVAAHRMRRPPHWVTVETIDLATQLRDDSGIPTLIDDLGGWLTAVMEEDSTGDGIDELLSAITTFGSILVIVSPEVGLSVVPATESGRRFADELGALNQRLAQICDRVVLIVAGQPLVVKDIDGER